MSTVARIAGAIVAVGLIACGSNGGPPDARVIDGPPPGGTFSFSWTIHDGATALSCGDLGTATVSAAIVADGAGFGVTDVWSCTSGTGTTRALAPGKYNLTVTLIGAGGPLAPAVSYADVITMSEKDTPLDPIDFAVTAKGGLAFKVAAKNQTANCGTGAGIDGMLLRVRDAQNNCEPATFTIGAGASSSGSTYTDDCTTAVVGPCIEQDQPITVSGLKSGSTRLVITGQTAGRACWSGTHFLTVPTSNSTRDYGALTLPADTVACPPVDAM